MMHLWKVAHDDDDDDDDDDDGDDENKDIYDNRNL